MGWWDFISKRRLHWFRWKVQQQLGWVLRPLVPPGLVPNEDQLEDCTVRATTVLLLYLAARTSCWSASRVLRGCAVASISFGEWRRIRPGGNRWVTQWIAKSAQKWYFSVHDENDGCMDCSASAIPGFRDVGKINGGPKLIENREGKMSAGRYHPLTINKMTWCIYLQ